MPGDVLAQENSGFSVDASLRITLIDRDVPKTGLTASLSSHEPAAVYAYFDDVTVGPLAAGK